MITTCATLDPPIAIEVDSQADCFGLIYRIWRGAKHLGNFYRFPDGKWIAEPFLPFSKERCDTAEQAQAAILKAWNLAS